MDFYSTKEVAALLSMPLETIRRHIRLGKLKAIKLGRQYRVTTDQLQQYLQKNTTK